MTIASGTRAPIDNLAAILRSGAADWQADGMSAQDLLAACEAEDLIGLMHERVEAAPDRWPQAIRDQLAVRARAAAAEELLRQHELGAVLQQLARAGVHPVLLKGTALAYGVYPFPAQRPRLDTDVLVRQQDRAAVLHTMTEIGYTAPVSCEGERLFRQFTLVRHDRFGVEHVFDVHWKISTQSAFADLLSYDELSAAAIPVTPLGPHARAAGLPHALLLACIHPVMHHRNMERLIWLYDIHLLVSRMSQEDLGCFVEQAAAKGVGAICARQLELAHCRFGTVIPAVAMTRLLASGSPALDDYLRPERGWHHELLWNLRGLRSWRDRAGLLREVLLPSPQYMLSSYGYTSRIQGFAVLPVLYAHRNLHGLWRVLARQK